MKVWELGENEGYCDACGKSFTHCNCVEFENLSLLNTEEEFFLELDDEEEESDDQEVQFPWDFLNPQET